VFDAVNFTLRPGTRIGLLGPNGAGKSTLIKLLAGELAPTAGLRTEGKGLAIGYFAQHQIEQLRSDESPIWHLMRMEPRTKEQFLRDYLGGFDFRGEMADAKVGPFSGGEKSRLALALLVRRRPNLLLLDEPTNHLDLEMRHALTRALAEYEGSLVLVSHDRALLRTVCDEFLIVADGSAMPFDGDLDDYLTWLTARRSAQAAAGAAGNSAAARTQSRQAPPAVQQPTREQKLTRRRPLMKESGQLERKIERWQQEQRMLEAQLADPAFDAADNQRYTEHVRRHAEVARLIEEAEQRWLEVHAEIDEIGEV
jgi:ATP-binding cassette subfamily F protein 3